MGNFYNHFGKEGVIDAPIIYSFSFTVISWDLHGQTNMILKRNDNGNFTVEILSLKVFLAFVDFIPGIWSDERLEGGFRTKQG